MGSFHFAKLQNLQSLQGCKMKIEGKPWTHSYNFNPSIENYSCFSLDY